ncbi:MAG TPA: amino acid-binding protein [Aeromicrobium sp.]|nr:amino acid-binding protein [Aeromicrobium sp.]
MGFLLRICLPDVPGSLGAVATALGSAGADIEAIEIVERRHDGTVVDDVMLSLPPSVMPDALVTACHAIDGVTVQWISRYAAGASLTRDLETVEELTAEPTHALARMVELLPGTFRSSWAVVVRPGNGSSQVSHTSSTAPDVSAVASGWIGLSQTQQLPPVDAWPSTTLVGVPAKGRDGEPFVVVVGRHGGPDFLDSEIARLGHIVALAASVQA